MDLNEFVRAYIHLTPTHTHSHSLSQTHTHTQTHYLKQANIHTPLVNFINVKRTNFSYECRFLHTCNSREKLPKWHFVRKICVINVDEIDTIFLSLLPFVAFHCRDLVSISPTYLHPAFTLVDPKRVKRLMNLTVFFTLLGSASVKAVRRMLMKLRPSDFLIDWESIEVQLTLSLQAILWQQTLLISYRQPLYDDDDI